jgi:hypothetical protein
LRGAFGDSCSTYAVFWIILAFIGFWPTVVWHGRAGWIGTAVWWAFCITVIIVLGAVKRKKKAASPEFQNARKAK